ncbi:AraC family transcriptional regulator [Ferrimonas balearica]|uniref:AraC family transcriptional regulator n=1 Tax=Ferrimonas balearica TaxID=44012 RepID=UPI001C94CC36|nr:AraC family transcriptional regulator [Ferrimonas balearica]MBY6223738.1 AraC family transcriptional regulator [Ferrimonas balearica]
MQYQVRSSALAGFDRLVVELGGDPLALLEAEHLHPSALASADMMLSYRAVARLLTRSARQLECADFGYRLGQRQGLELLGALGVYLCIQDSLFDAFEVGLKALDYHVQGIHIDAVGEHGCTEFRLGFAFEGELDCQQLRQLTLSNIANIVSELSGGQCVPCQPLTHGASTLVFASADLAQPVNTSEVMRQRLFARWRRQAPSRPSPQQVPVDEAVTRAILALLPTGDVSLFSIARVLELPARTLQYRLRQCGSSYGALLQGCRRQLACQWLEQTEFTVTDIALRLGYAEPAVFNRAFKGWYGVSPSQWRLGERVR